MRPAEELNYQIEVLERQMAKLEQQTIGTIESELQLFGLDIGSPYDRLTEQVAKDRARWIGLKAQLELLQWVRGDTEGYPWM